MNVSFGHYVSVIYRHLQIYLNHQFTVFGFGSGQYMFFNFISHHEGTTQKELSRKLVIDKATTAKAVNKLIQLGYVEGVQKEEDRRSYGLYLTDKGREILPEVQSILRGTTEILQEGMRPEEIQNARRALEHMLGNITGIVHDSRKINE